MLSGSASLRSSWSRPRVGLWPVLDRHRRWLDEPPATALLERLPLPVGANPSAALESAGQVFLDGENGVGLHSGVLALDPWAWQVLRFTLWQGRVGATVHAENARRYEVLHLSAPGSAPPTVLQAAAAVG